MSLTPSSPSTSSPDDATSSLSPRPEGIPVGEEGGLASSPASQSLAQLVQSSVANSREHAIEGQTEARDPQGSAPLPPGSGSQKPKPKQQLTPAQAFRAMVFLTLSITIFASVILGYIVFHPEDARFFISLGIDPDNIAQVLKKLISTTFSVTTLTLSGVVITTLYKFLSIKDPEQKKKKIFFGVISLLVFLLLFGVLSFWAYLFQKIGSVDFTNPTGGIRIYDNEKYLDTKLKTASRIDPTATLVGPLTIRFDVKANALKAKQIIDIEGYQISFDNDSSQGSGIKQGVNPFTDNTIIASYDRAQKYNPTGYYYGVDRVTRKPRQVEMIIPSFTITSVVKMTSEAEVVKLDASSLKDFGEINWYRDGKILTSNSPIYIARIENTDYGVCLSIVNAAGGATNACNKFLIIPGRDRSPITGDLLIDPAPQGGLAYTFSVQNPQTKQGGEILEYQWMVNGNQVGKGSEYVHTFSKYGNYEVSLRMVDASSQSITLTKTLDIKEPRSLVSGSNAFSLLDLRRASEDGSIQSNILPFSFNREIGASVIRGITAGTKLEYNAEEVRANGRAGESLTLKDVEVYFDDRRVTGGIRGEITIPQSDKYNIYFRYTFSTNRGESDVITEKIVIESSEQAINPSLQMKSSGDYAPVTVDFDASASQVRSGKIAKYIFDFGEGRPPTEGDAVQTYIYDKAGEYTITLTIVKDNGERASLRRNLVIKSQPKILSISRSLSSAQIGQSVDFSVSSLSNNISNYYWDFGDDAISSEEAPTHVYNKGGSYRVSLRVRYTDGTTALAESSIRVE